MANIKKEKPTDQEPRDKNGLKHGEWIGYYYNRQLSYRHNFVNDVQHGFFEGYYYNGGLSYCGHYNMGKKVGYWRYYSVLKYYFLCLI